MPEWKDTIKEGIVAVGGGRGFILEMRYRFLERVIITAAHCLPNLPPAHPWSSIEERTFANLVGLVGTGDESVAARFWVECLFVDPVADIAVLGEPDSQTLFDEAEAYNNFIASVPSFQIADPSVTSDAWIMALSGDWLSCTAVAQSKKGCFTISECSGTGIRFGMSGSPIVSNTGAAMGVISTGDAEGGGPQPNLNGNLPGAMFP